VALDELAANPGPSSTLLSSLAAKMHEFNRTAEQLSLGIAGASTISPTLQEVLNRTMEQTCGPATAAVEKGMKSLSPESTGEIMDSVALTRYNDWASLQTKVLQSLQELVTI
jgi:hypothetical protein